MRSHILILAAALIAPACYAHGVTDERAATFDRYGHSVAPATMDGATLYALPTFGLANTPLVVERPQGFVTTLEVAPVGCYVVRQVTAHGSGGMPG